MPPSSFLRPSLSLFFFSFPVLILPVALSMKGESERGERWRAGERNKEETTRKKGRDFLLMW